MKPREVDITDLLVQARELTSEEQRIEKRKWELRSLAGNEALDKMNAGARFSPLRLLKMSDRIYRGYLKAEGLKYDEGRGF